MTKLWCYCDCVNVVVIILVHNCQLSAPSPMHLISHQLARLYSTAILLWITHLHTCSVHQFSMCIMWHSTTLACRYNAKSKSTKYFVHGHLEKSAKRNIWYKISSYTIVSQWQSIQSITSICTPLIVVANAHSILLSQGWICYRAYAYFSTIMVRICIN